MKILKHTNKTENEIIASVSQALTKEELVILPTDTVYGLMALASSDRAIDRLYKAKKRDLGKPTALLVASLNKAQEYIGNDIVSKLGKRFWPGPLTIVNKAKKRIGTWDKIGIRVPNDSLLLKVLTKIGRPVMASSANISGEKEPKEASQISKALSDHVSIIVDNGPTSFARASTVVEIAGDQVNVLREGPVSKEDIERIIKGSG